MFITSHLKMVVIQFLEYASILTFKIVSYFHSRNVTMQI